MPLFIIVFPKDLCDTTEVLTKSRVSNNITQMIYALLILINFVSAAFLGTLLKYELCVFSYS